MQLHQYNSDPLLRLLGICYKRIPWYMIFLFSDKKSFSHLFFFSKSFILVRTAAGLEPNPGTLNLLWQYTLYLSQTHIQHSFKPARAEDPGRPRGNLHGHKAFMIMILIESMCNYKSTHYQAAYLANCYQGFSSLPSLFMLNNAKFNVWCILSVIVMLFMYKQMFSYTSFAGAMAHWSY